MLKELNALELHVKESSMLKELNAKDLHATELHAKDPLALEFHAEVLHPLPITDNLIHRQGDVL
jgi:hypothetical protein